MKIFCFLIPYLIKKSQDGFFLINECNLTKLKHFLKHLKTSSLYNVVKIKGKEVIILNKNEKELIVQKIRTQYTEKQYSKLDELKDLDKKVKRPANVFAYIFGCLAAIIMGSGMSLVMTDIGSYVGIQNPLVPGVIVGVIGLFMSLTNYSIFKRILSSRREKFADEIIRLSDEIKNS